MSELERELSAVLNRYSADNAANTPDYVLAMYLSACLLVERGLAAAEVLEAQLERVKS